MRKTIQIGDKYKPLMEYYNSQFDREEFNVFFIKILIAYKKMKDKNIDLIMLSDIIEPYDIDIVQLLKIIDNAKPSKTIDTFFKKETKSLNQEPKQEENLPRQEKKDNGMNFKKKTNAEKTQKANKLKDPILSLGINLSE